jgi:hypothetical protein
MACLFVALCVMIVGGMLNSRSGRIIIIIKP